MPHVIIKFVGILLLVPITMYLIDLKYNKNRSPIIIIDKITVVNIVNDKFLSIALDTSLIKNGLIRRMKEKKFLQRASFLSPAFLRIGGTNADRLIFVEHETDVSNKLAQISTFPLSQREDFYECNSAHDNFTMTGKVWSDINEFSGKCGLHLVFDLNVLLRNHNKWDSSNAQDILQYSSRFNHDIVWQLGNEPNAFKHVFGMPISPIQLGNDFRELRKLLTKFPNYRKSKIIGPDVTRPKLLGENPIQYLNDFLLSVDNSTINAVTWHQYYLNGRTATLHDFIDPDIFNILKKQIIAVKNVVEKEFPEFPIWLSETSSAYGGGAPGLSNTFIAGFLWLDKLGVAARLGISVVVRQSLYYGHYSLLDYHTLDPLPDWWLSVLYKKLVGTTVLDVGQFINGSGSFRLYAHCSIKDETITNRSIITLFGINLRNSESVFHIQSNGSPETAYISVYILKGCESLTSRFVCLNGNRLILKSDGTVPTFQPIISSLHSPLGLPPYSLGFWTLHGISTNVCDNI